MNNLAERLLSKGAFTPKAFNEITSEAKKHQLSLITYLLKKELIDPLLLAKIIAQDFGLPFVDLDMMDKSQFPIHIVHEKLIRKHKVLPIWQKDKKLCVAIADPTQQNIFDEIKFQTGLAIQWAIAAKDKLDQTIEEVLAIQYSSLNNLDDIDLNDITITSEDINLANSFSDSDDDAPIVRYVNKILLNAIQQNASDIHFEPCEKNFQIRFRIDGLLHSVTNLSSQHANRVVARIKIMSQLDIAERRIPQDGRFKVIVKDKQAIDCRLSTCPTIYGEKIVVRILDANKVCLEVDSLGFSEQQKTIFLEALQNPHGMILVTGPTGSGKTVTLYTALHSLNTSTVNISTVEDPVEIHLPGINQVNINPKAGLEFSTVLRAFLRQDPDIIMVGEMRDLETAEIGIKAAQTGHLVLSTLHTNNSAEAVTRLVNMGIPLYNIATSVTLVIAQRLARKLCEHCKYSISLPKKILLQTGFAAEDINTLKIFEAKGCKQCTHGYKGRIGIFEFLPINKSIAELILHSKSTLEVTAQAQREGMQLLRTIALDKVKQGITSLTEINRVIKS